MDIQKVIRERGFSQNQVADALGVTKSSLSQSVHNDNTSVKMMRRIADIIGCRVGDFFADEMTVEEEGMVALVSAHGRFWRCASTSELRKAADEIDALGKGVSQ